MHKTGGVVFQEFEGLIDQLRFCGLVKPTRLSSSNQIESETNPKAGTQFRALESMKDNVLFAPKVPLCSYAALFDSRPMFDAIRVAFMRAADPTMTLNTFTDSLKKLVDQARRVRFGAPCVLACMLSLQQRAPRQVIRDFPG